MKRMFSVKNINICIAFLAFGAVSLDFIFFIYFNKNPNLMFETINYFSYFTILSNLCLGISSTILVFKPNAYSIPFQVLRVGSIICIIITGIVFNLLLRPIFTPHYIATHITNEIFHVINPVLGFIIFTCYKTKPMINKKIVGLAIIPPILYAIYTFIRGYFTGFYPYFFININKVGFLITFLSVSSIIILFLIIAFILYTIEKKRTI